MPNGRAKKGGQIGLNGEFYKGGSFLPSTTRSKQAPVKKITPQPKKPLADWQIENIKKAIEGTKTTIEISKSEGNLRAVEANEAYLEVLIKQLPQ